MKNFVKTVKILGIESTAHTFSIAVAEKKGNKISILSNAADKYPSTAEGYIPWKLADHHAQVYPQVLEKALVDAKVSLNKNEIGAVAFSQGSGIGHCLHVGYVVAKSLSAILKVPLVGVNHGVAHIEIGKTFNCETRDPLIVYVSGGNTQIMTLDKKQHYYHVYGETIDIGIGNFLDVLGRRLALSPPDAVGVLRVAAEPANFITLPYTVRGMNLAFSGLQTYIEKKLIPLVKQKKISAADVCFSAQETAFSMLCEATERALCHTKKKEILLCGGNARNRRLQEMLQLVCDEHKINFAVTDDIYSGDQAAMIALTGAKMLDARCVSKDTMPRQRMRTDVTHVCW